MSSGKPVSSNVALGFLILFALPFAAVGLWMAFLISSSLWSAGAMQQWQPVPATILDVELQQHKSSSTVTAKYRYEWNGRSYSGERVGIDSSGDNIGNWHDRLYDELRQQQLNGETRTAWVNPGAPEQAVLDRSLRLEKLGFYLLFALVFGGAGFGLIIAGVLGRRNWRRTEAQKAQHPGKPWLHREDWAAGEVRSAAGPTLILSLIFAFFWNLISLPAFIIVPREIEKGNHLALLALFFPLVGFGFLVWAIRCLIRWRKFGRARLALDTLPGNVGGMVTGTVHTGSMLRPEAGFVVTLDGVQRRTTGGGKNQSTSESIFHQETLTLPQAQVGLGANGSTIPVRFAIPAESPPTDDSDPRNRFLWRITITAEVPGVDYLSTFEVPVFRTGEPLTEVAATGPVKSDENDEKLLTQAGVRLRQEAEGLAIELPMARHKGVALGMMVFGAIWSGAIALMLAKEVPLLFIAVFALADLLIVYFILSLWFYAVRIVVRPGELSRRGGLFGLGRRRSWLAPEIAALQPKAGMQSGRKLFYDLQLLPQGGRAKVIAHSLNSRAQAEAMARRINVILRS